MTSVGAAAAAAAHFLGVALVFACLGLRLSALARHDVVATRRWDNVNGLAAIVVYGAGAYRLFGGIEKPLAFYTSNPFFWVKVALLGVAFALEVYPQWVVLPWHIRASRNLPIEPEPLQFERMRRLVAWQAPCFVGAIVAASLMSRGVGLARSGPPNDAPGGPSLLVADEAMLARGRAVYERHCVACHQPDGRGLDGRAAADFTRRPGPLDKSDEELATSIRLGRAGSVGAMPPWEGILSSDEQRAVLAWIRQRYRSTH